MSRVRLTGLVVLVVGALGVYAQDKSNSAIPTLSSVLWNIGIVNQEQTQSSREIGEDLIRLIELPVKTDWVSGLSNDTMQEAMLFVPMWAVLDGSGFRGGGNVSVWCDNGKLFHDTVQIHDLKPGEGDTTVAWSFDGETFVESTWSQKDRFIIPNDDFPHGKFVKRFVSARHLVLRTKGVAGLDVRSSRVKRTESFAVLPIPLWGDKTALKKIVNNCSE